MISLAKPKIALPASLPGSAASLSLLVALYLAPLSLDPVSNTLAFKSNATYASENIKTDNGPDNMSGDSSNSEQGNGMAASSDNGSANSSDNGSNDNLNNGADGGSNDGLGNDNASNSHSDNNNNNNGDDSENHRGALRPANLAEFLSSLRNGSRIVNAERTSNKIEIQYSDGWREQIEDGVYTLAGPNDNVVIRRPATKRDYTRLNSAF